jgi:hypothetical protein
MNSDLKDSTLRTQSGSLLQKESKDLPTPFLPSMEVQECASERPSQKTLSEPLSQSSSIS